MNEHLVKLPDGSLSTSEALGSDIYPLPPEVEAEKIRRVLRATAPACVKRIALNYAGSTRAQPFKRVSSSFLAAVEANALNFIKDRVDHHPSRGVTLM